jgi:osmotically-inducible protein OsmY
MPERWDYRNRDEVRGYEYDRDRDRDRDREHRGPLERAGDQVRSWFGDDEAARRRRADEMRQDRDRDRDRSWHERDRNAAERAWDRTTETARDVTDRDHDGRRGLSEWNDNDQSRNFGDKSRYAADDRYSPVRSGSPYAESVNRPHERDWNSPDYTGRGPRGYQRSDARMFEDICDRLTVDPRIDASDVEVDVKQGEVTLRGSVRSREEKRAAEDIVEHIMGVREVNNHLKVTRADHVLGSARSGATGPLGVTDVPPPPPEPRK